MTFDKQKWVTNASSGRWKQLICLEIMAPCDWPLNTSPMFLKWYLNTSPMLFLKWYFSRIVYKASVVYKLFQSYCMSYMGRYFGYSACRQQHSHRRSVSHGGKIATCLYRLPYKTHCYLLPLSSECLSLEYDICRWSLHCIREYLSNRSRLVNAIATCGICYDRYDSSPGHNALFKMSVCDIAVK